MVETENASLTNIELLSDLPAKALENLSKRCSRRTFQINGQVIDQQSGSCDLCFIVKGRAHVVNYYLSGREVTFDDRE
ncbi:MAG: Crp/Fnr family transcriptional regulator, partial [Pseudomonadota bacterium]|nr:Crp/Fnr family transcriptional regulator [Pseudomonadota bacterium]